MGRVKGGLGHPDHQSDPPPAPRPNPPPPAGTCQLPGGGGGRRRCFATGADTGVRGGGWGGGRAAGRPPGWRPLAVHCRWRGLAPRPPGGVPSAKRWTSSPRRALGTALAVERGDWGGGGLEEEVGGWWWRWCCTEGSSGGGWCPLYATWVSGCRPVWPCRLIDCRLRHTIGWLKWRRAAATRAPSNSGCTICRCIGLSATMTEPERRWNCRGSGPAPTRPPRVCGM